MPDTDTMPSSASVSYTCKSAGMLRPPRNPRFAGCGVNVNRERERLYFMPPSPYDIRRLVAVNRSVIRKSLRYPKQFTDTGDPARVQLTKS